MSETAAQQAKQVILADRTAQIAALTQAAEGRADLDEAMSRIDEGVTFAGTADIPGAMLTELAGPILDVWRADPPAAPRRDPDLLQFVSVDAEQGTAETQAFPDGSGLIRITDAMISLPSYMAMLLALARYTRRSGLRALWKPRPGPAEDIAMMTALLRYHVHHQRLFGLAGKAGVNLTGQPERFAAMITSGATAFLLAHEIAHFMLGHGTAHADPVLEFEADRIGFDVACRVLGLREFTGIGANVTMFGIGLIERTLYVRRPRTHPDAAERWRRLGKPATRHWRLVDLLDRAVGRAADVSQPVPRDDWRHAWSRPGVAPYHDGPYLEQLAALDVLQSRSAADLTANLAGADGAAGEFGAPLTRADRTLESLFEAWSLPARTRRRLLSRDEPLTFFGLHSALAKAPILRPESGRSALSIPALHAACVIQSDLSGNQGEPT